MSKEVKEKMAEGVEEIVCGGVQNAGESSETLWIGLLLSCCEGALWDSSAPDARARCSRLDGRRTTRRAFMGYE